MKGAARVAFPQAIVDCHKPVAMDGSRGRLTHRALEVYVASPLQWDGWGVKDDRDWRTGQLALALC